MILFELICADGHSFECWFRDNVTCETQLGEGEVACPTCGDTLVRKAPMAPRIARAGREADKNQVSDQVGEVLSQLRDYIEANSDYVGSGFAEEARKIHYGEAEKRSIYGEASAKEASDLREEGIDAVIVPWSRRQDS